MEQNNQQPGKPIQIHIRQVATSSQQRQQQPVVLYAMMPNSGQHQIVNHQIQPSQQQQTQYNIMPLPLVTRARELSMIHFAPRAIHRKLFINIGNVDIVWSNFPVPPLIPPAYGPVHTNTISINNSELDNLNISVFATRFPSVDLLEVVINGAKPQKCINDFLIPLISKWNGTLREFHIWAIFANPTSKSEFDAMNYYCNRLVLAMNPLRLSHLTLDLNASIGLLNNEQSLPKIDLPVLKTLSHFNISTLDKGSSLVATLLDNSNAGLQEMRIANPLSQDDIDALTPKDIRKKEKYVANSCKMLITTDRNNLSFMFEQPQRWLNFCEHFINLTHLRVRISESLTTRDWVLPLTKLTTLENLYIENVTKNTLKCDDIRVSSLTRMKTLSVLSLKLEDLKSHDHLSSPFWNTLFPALKYIHVYHDMSACDDCNYHSFQELTKDQQFVCLKRVANPVCVCKTAVYICLKQVLDNSFCEFFDCEVISDGYEWFTDKH